MHYLDRCDLEEVKRQKAKARDEYSKAVAALNSPSAKDATEADDEVQEGSSNQTRADNLVILTLAGSLAASTDADSLAVLVHADYPKGLTRRAN
ncbi:hypothetical protein PHYPSEUDO_007645 [Phytophthora pseudosyringae]|uniref:Uncharacterized protein n=1 Tax=Phytophthora pseudosyringae TaxID=221518 RepID=A0A8T1VGK6_9STRA|nr:hypothetical protein PHYPSEUDO_007645 [Phytophthora pseudosyringae]